MLISSIYWHRTDPFSKTSGHIEASSNYIASCRLFFSVDLNIVLTWLNFRQIRSKTLPEFTPLFDAPHTHSVINWSRGNREQHAFVNGIREIIEEEGESATGRKVVDGI